LEHRSLAPYMRVVVHEKEAESYAHTYPLHRVDSVSVMGIGRVRQEILTAARAMGQDRIWLLDDDITHFLHRTDVRHEPVDALVALEAMEQAAEAMGAALAGPSVVQFAWNAPDVTMNRRIGIATLLDTTGPWNYWPRFHEDADMLLQIREAGRTTARFGDWAIRTALMGKNPGGCLTDYQAGEGEAAGIELEERWRTRLPGVVGTRINPRGQTISTIRWALLDKYADNAL
jgi:hypothetical protein